MPKFKITASYSTTCILEIEANNENEAYEIALNADGGDFIQINQPYDWEINNVSEVK
jgi:hypothetical protein